LQILGWFWACFIRRLGCFFNQHLATLLPSLHKRSRVRSSRLAAVLYENGLFFYKFILQCLMTALKGKGKAAVKIGM